MLRESVIRSPYQRFSCFGTDAGAWSTLSPYASETRSLWRAPRLGDVQLSEGRDTLYSLIVRCNRGERAAWEEFYGRYAGLVARVVSRLGSGDSNENEDLVQEVFLHLFSALRRYDQTRPIEAYILEIARRVRISRYRKNTAAKRGGCYRTTVPVDAHDGGEAGFIAIPSAESDQESALIRAQQTGMIRRALMNLSESCRRLLSMRYYRGLSYREISAALDAREGTLRVRVQRCLSSLARRYAELTLEEGNNP